MEKFGPCLSRSRRGQSGGTGGGLGFGNSDRKDESGNKWPDGVPHMADNEMRDRKVERLNSEVKVTLCFFRWFDRDCR